MIPPDAGGSAEHDAAARHVADEQRAVRRICACRQQDLPNAPVVKALDGQNVRLPGYIVPLEVSEEGRTTEFLLVPISAPASTFPAAALEPDRACQAKSA
jgi:hypothetical protein